MLLIDSISGYWGIEKPRGVEYSSGLRVLSCPWLLRYLLGVLFILLCTYVTSALFNGEWHKHGVKA